MSEKIIARASAVIDARKDYIGGGMEGYAVLALLNDQGSPTASTLTISKADGINWMTFIVDLSCNKAARAKADNRASVCLASSEYNITLVGKVELITDPDAKKAHWQEVFKVGHGVDYDAPSHGIMKFTTESYNLFFADPYEGAKGDL